MVAFIAEKAQELASSTAARNWRESAPKSLEPGRLKAHALRATRLRAIPVYSSLYGGANAPEIGAPPPGEARQSSAPRRLPPRRTAPKAPYIPTSSACTPCDLTRSSICPELVA